MRILVISYFFPPSRSAGVIRVRKLTGYWTQSGHDVTVVTSDDVIGLRGRAPDGQDQDLRRVQIERVPTPLRPKLLEMWRAHGRTTVRSKQRTDRPSLPDRVGFARRVRDQVLLPDHAILWGPQASRRALDLLRIRYFDVVFATGNPWSNLISAAWVARRAGLPLAVDFRDPWADGPVYAGLDGWSAWERLAHRHLEGWVCRQASAVTATTGKIASRIGYRWPNAVSPQVVENGYDPAESAAVHVAQDPGVFRIVMTSSFRAGHRIQAFVTALRRVVERGALGRRKLIFSFAGTSRPMGVEKGLADYLADVGLRHILDDRGFVPRREALELQASADLLLFVETEFGSLPGGMVGTEFYEYLSTGRPILLLDQPDSAVWDVGRSAGTVRRYDRDDDAGIFEALSAAVEGHWSGKPDWAWIGRFSRKAQADRMIEIFESARENPPLGL